MYFIKSSPSLSDQRHPAEKSKKSHPTLHSEKHPRRMTGDHVYRDEFIMKRRKVIGTEGDENNSAKHPQHAIRGIFHCY